MSGTLGIYFGVKLITLVQVRGKKVIDTFQIQRSLISSGELDEKVPDDVKMAALFKEELRKSKQEAKEAAFCLSGKDLIIRTFEIPILPSNELPNVINYEVKKYIPFKVEDMVSSYQIALDKPNNRNQVLFVGLKKDILDKHISVINQLNIPKIISVEYSVFAILRFLKLTSFKNKGIVAVMSLDFAEDDEVNFTILENGFPLFSRDIALSGGPEELVKASGSAAGSMLDKLKNEIRISLDYYHRKFPTKNINRIYFICNDELRMDLELFFNEVSLPAHFVNVSRLMGLHRGYSLGFIKAYGAAIFKQVRIDLRINIFSSHAKSKVVKELAAPVDLKSLVSGVTLDRRVLVIAALICLATFGYMFYQRFPVQKQIDEILAKRPQISGVNTEVSLEELRALGREYDKKVETLKATVADQVSFTQVMNVIARLLPDDMRLTNLQYQRNDKDQIELVVQGFAYTGNGDQEREMITNFVSEMRKDAEVKEYFKDVALVSIDHNQFEGVLVTRFNITCKN